MKAVQINSYGGNEVLEINSAAPTPILSDNQILVEVRAASINPFDLTIRSGYLKDKMPLPFPITLGGDFSGVALDSIEEVYGQALAIRGASGAFAEILAVSKESVSTKPKSATFTEAAALPLVGVSAVQALEEHIKLQRGQKILIHGGAGGIGHIAIQLAKSIGAYVATTAGEDGLEFVKALGADEVINYKSQKFEDVIKDYDAVFDTVGGEATNKSLQVLKKGLSAQAGGILVTMVGQPDMEIAKKLGVTAVVQGTKVNTESLSRLAELVDAGKIKVNVDKVFALSSAKEALNYFEKSHPKGKVVLEVTKG